MTADGKSGIAVKAWRYTDNASSYNRFLFMVNDKNDSNAPWQVVFVETPDKRDLNARDSLRDEPHTDEDAVDAVYLARANVDGKSEVIMLEAYRDTSKNQSIPDPGMVTLKTYRLVIAEEGFPGYKFLLTSIAKSKRKYSNVNCALEKEFAVTFTSETKAEATACPQ
jgi:hypothetical protein